MLDGKIKQTIKKKRQHQRYDASLTTVGHEAEEEDDDARQQHHHQDQTRQEDGPARRPARHSEQSARHAARLPATALQRRAGKPHVQGAVH